MRAMKRAMSAVRSTAALVKSGSRSTAVERVYVASSEKSEDEEPEADAVPDALPARKARSPTGPSKAWGQAGSSPSKASQSAQHGMKDGAALPGAPSASERATAETALHERQAQESQVPGSCDEDSLASPAASVKATEPAPVVSVQDVRAGYNSRAQDRERWLASLGGDFEAAASQPTLVQAETRSLRSPMEWEQKPTNTGALSDQASGGGVLSLAEQRKARQGGSAAAEAAPILLHSAPPVAGVVPLRDPSEVFNEQLKSFNLQMKRADGPEQDPYSGNVRVTWSFGVPRGIAV
eukprot:TRINITY_DN99269_c0_g1_i1.p1 TRINITY_DN99269_c0_g1~~TRINITY_DN99269_c0_g1_i1.p1  ORF type:complete len:316 (+),score=69.06 TRINITY_DN99269_c0_g1_i1:66-950(+)